MQRQSYRIDLCLDWLEKLATSDGFGGSPGAEADEACARAGLDKIRDRLR
jgi:hypothetical protein